MILPNQSKAIVKNQWGGAVLRLWNIECNSQIGETIIIEHTREFGYRIFCFTPDGEKVIFIHNIKFMQEYK